MKKWPLRIFLGFIVLLCGYVSAQAYGLIMARYSLSDFSDGYVIAPENADLDVVMYLDYSCPFCREAYPLLMAAIKEDGKIRFAPRPVMTTNADGTTGAYLTYAAGKQGKFFEMMDYLMINHENLTPERLTEISEGAGVDSTKLETDLKDLDIDGAVRGNSQKMIALGVTGTPAIFINGQILNTESTLEKADYQKLFAMARGQASQ